MKAKFFLFLAAMSLNVSYADYVGSSIGGYFHDQIIIDTVKTTVLAQDDFALLKNIISNCGASSDNLQLINKKSKSTGSEFRWSISMKSLKAQRNCVQAELVKYNNEYDDSVIEI